MQKVTFQITGISPLMTNNPQKMRRSDDGGIKKKTIPTAEDEAEGGTYRFEDGQLYFPASAFRSSMIEGAKGRKIGKMGAGTVIKGAVFNLQEECPLVSPDDGEPLHDYVIDEQRAVIQGNGVIRARPRLDEWATTVEFEHDEDFISAASINEILNIAGRTVGIGEYRPRVAGSRGTGGSFGRFQAELLD